MGSTYQIRTATPDDAATISAHRRAMFEDMGEGDPDQLAWMVREYEPYARQAIAEGKYRGWLVMLGDEIVGGAGLAFIEWPANPWSRMKARPTVMNVYVAPEHRRRGLARRLLETIITWARDNKIEFLELSASTKGRALYESLGFEPEPTIMHLHL